MGNPERRTNPNVYTSEQTQELLLRLQAEIEAERGGRVALAQIVAEALTLYKRCRLDQ